MDSDSVYSSKFNKTSYSAKFLNNKIQKFIENLEIIQKNLASQDYDEFDKIKVLLKENK